MLKKVDMESLRHLIGTTRSIRRFKPDLSVSPDLLMGVIDTVRTVSSAKNRQPLRYIIVTSKDAVSAIAERSSWAGALGGWRPSPEEYPSAFILILEKVDIAEYATLDAGIALQSLMLMLHAGGYASCAIGTLDKRDCVERFNISSEYNLLLGLAVGVPIEHSETVPLKDSIDYYRDEDGLHYVPKRSLDEVVLSVIK